jgi:Rod binding domain-containing protein
VKVYFPVPSLTYREAVGRDIKKAAQEFEAIMITQILKEAYRPLMKDKGFMMRMNYEMFLEGIGRALAKGGGIGLAKFIIENYAGGGHSSEREDRKSPEAVRREVYEKSIHSL